MGFLHSLKERLSDAVHHQPAHIEDADLGELEQVGPGLWRTLDPVAVVDGIAGAALPLGGGEPVYVTFEGDAHGPFPDLLASLRELPNRYHAMWPEIEQVLRAADPRSLSSRLRFSTLVVLSGVEIWRDPSDHHPVIALEYAIEDLPECTFIVRIEQWQPVDVIITG